MDELVASAVAHWGPRLTVNGGAVADFERVVAARLLAELAERVEHPLRFLP
jgi:hypothetical protein